MASEATGDELRRMMTQTTTGVVPHDSTVTSVMLAVSVVLLSTLVWFLYTRVLGRGSQDAAASTKAKATGGDDGQHDDDDATARRSAAERRQRRAAERQRQTGAGGAAAATGGMDGEQQDGEPQDDDDDGAPVAGGGPRDARQTLAAARQRAAEAAAEERTLKAQDRAARELEREEKQRQREQLEEETLQKLRQERDAKAKQEYQQWVSHIAVEEKGEAASTASLQSADERRASILSNIRSAKLVVLEDLVKELGLASEEALVQDIEALIKDGRLNGVFDDRGKFVEVTQEEFASVARFVRQRGRVSISDLTAECNRVIRV